jgi:hypothetical protein
MIQLMTLIHPLEAVGGKKINQQILMEILPFTEKHTELSLGEIGEKKH